MTDPLEAARVLVAAAHKLPWPVQKLIGTPEDVHQRNADERLKCVAVNTWLELVEALDAIKRIGLAGGSAWAMKQRARAALDHVAREVEP